MKPFFPPLCSLCSLCARPRTEACSHVDCPNRKPVTARAVGSVSLTSGSDKDGFPRPGSAIVRKPHLFDE